MKLLILTPIAERDVHFYLALADKILKDIQVKIYFLSFYQPGNELIKSAGFNVIDPYPLLENSLPPAWTENNMIAHFQTPDLSQLIVHEQLTFGITDKNKVIKKFLHYSYAIDQSLDQLEREYPQVSSKHILQELAGFIGPLSLFYVSKKRGWNNWMTEPSFFKGRIHLVNNSLYLNIPKCEPTLETKNAVDSYIDRALREKVIVAATKDAHHYKDMGFAKVFNFTNALKLIKKISNKYLFQRKQEFEYIGNHVQRYIKMLINRMKNENYYMQIAQLPNDKLLIYFPFHVQLDFSLTIRSPDWLDQLNLIEKIVELLPENAVLISKEHPASIGCLDQSRLNLLFQNKKFRLLHPMVNSHDVLEKCKAVVTINSKVGAEALLKGLPIFTFGKAFYTDRGLAPHFATWTQFSLWLDSLSRIDSNAKTTAKNQDLLKFLYQVWQDGFDTELYDLSSENINKFSYGVKFKLFG